MEKVLCQRIGCNATFSEDDNPDGSCTYHASGPSFHNGMKEWSCCKKRSHDFTLFLDIPGCNTGKHTTEKPVLAKPTTVTPKKLILPSQPPSTNASAKEVICSRCLQGFFCSGHGSQLAKEAILVKPSNILMEDSSRNLATPLAPAKKIVIGINQPQICKNKGCGETFKEKDNHDTACVYHPGPAVFRDRRRGWQCCDKEFDEFITIDPCTKGWHNADSVS